ncbi:MAG TPA: hypothetical protein VKR61_11375 [Bryobacteraceae bacterium]|nr:hypothetical protein [Bryobacteraceae bacterium]
MASGGLLWWIAAGGLSIAAFGKNALWKEPIPSDPLEMVTGQIRAVDARDSRAAALQLLDRARNQYALRNAGHGYDLQVSFTVNSGGQTEFDGAWKMEDVFDPKQGLRWTAQSPASYAITRISSNGMLYSEDTAGYIPLRLQEARAALFDPIPSAERAARASIRTSTANFNGAQLTCILLSEPGRSARSTTGRRWDETEECVDPQSGLLRTHSQVPGRYSAYEYSDAPGIAGRMLPRKVTVTEAGKVVTEISVDSLTELPAADKSLFEPTGEMKERGRAIALAEAQKIWRVLGRGPYAAGAPPQIVCVFGVVTPSGELAEAHSLQPSNPYSRAAVEAAKHMSFPKPPPSGVRPQQHFVFVIEKFVASR